MRCLGAGVAACAAIVLVGQEVHAEAATVHERRGAQAAAGVTQLSRKAEGAAGPAVFFVARQVQARAGAVRGTWLADRRAAAEAAHARCRAASLAGAAVRWIGLYVDAAAVAFGLARRAGALAGRT